MNTVEQESNYLSHGLQSTTELFFPVTSLISLSLLSLILLHRYIKYRLRQAHTTSAFKEQKEQDFWLQSIMEKGNIISPGLLAPSACDILQPLSHTSLLPSSGTLAAQVREQQSETSRSIASSPGSLNSSSPGAGEVQKCNETTQQMCDVDAEGVRTWKRVVVEYK